MAVIQLNDLDFSPGIRAQPINENFQLVHDWICRERLRIGGWGIVEGFDMQCDDKDFSVYVSSGVMINYQGEEVAVPAASFATGELSTTTVTKTYTADINGRIILDEYVYDSTTHKYATYNPPTISTPLPRKAISVQDSDGYYVPIARLLEKTLWVNANEYRNKTLTVTQTTAIDRVDTLMLRKNGTYEYVTSIDSTSPSHINLEKNFDLYDEFFCIAVIHWSVSTTGINCEFFLNHRSYRPIYVDRNNTIYLYGKEYKNQKFIYFEEPPEEEREINDLWYDNETNTLYIWRYHGGDLGWTVVNDHSDIIIQEKKIWAPSQCPSDLRTFKFSDDELNLYFVPGTHALSIVIDNTVIMDDQYAETQLNADDVSYMRERLEDRESALELLQTYVETQREERQTINDTILDLRNRLASLLASKKTVARNLEILDVTKLLSDALTDVDGLTTEIEVMDRRISLLEDEIKLLHSITDGTYISTGTGFILERPLDRACYVEVTVTHQVRMQPAREMFQRAAVFVQEGVISVAEPDSTGLICTTEGVYCVGENQLEIFLNGIRLSRKQEQFFECIDDLTSDQKVSYGARVMTSPDFVQVLDYRYMEPQLVSDFRNHSSQHFRVAVSLAQNDLITYKISKWVWSYDQLDALIHKFELFASGAYDRATAAYEEVQSFTTRIQNIINEIRATLTLINRKIVEIDSCYRRGDTIQESDIPEDIKNRLVGSGIDFWQSASPGTFDILNCELTVDNNGNITGGDFFEVFYHDASTNKWSVLMRNDSNGYTATYNEPNGEEGHGSVTISLTNSDMRLSSNKVYVKGFRRGLNR